MRPEASPSQSPLHDGRARRTSRWGRERPRTPARRARLTAHLALALLTAAGLAAASCSSRPASYPDEKGVASAQSAWCDMLQKLQKDPAWSRLGECKSATPTASAAYLKGMAKCYFDKIQSEGENAPDNTTIVDECNTGTLATMNGDESIGAEVIAARCRRMERCEKVPVAECKAAIDKLESGTRAEITMKYNGAALHEVADCLDSASCTDDEDSARQSCYKPAAEKLLWFP